MRTADSDFVTAFAATQHHHLPAPDCRLDCCPAAALVLPLSRWFPVRFSFALFACFALSALHMVRVHGAGQNAIADYLR